MSTFILELNPETVNDGDGVVEFDAILDSDDLISATLELRMWKAYGSPKTVLLQVIS
jgi:hypothetical protein